MAFNGAAFYGLPVQQQQPQASTSAVPYGANSATSSSAHHGQQPARGRGRGRGGIIQRPATSSNHHAAASSSSANGRHQANQAAFPNNQKYFAKPDVVKAVAASAPAASQPYYADPSPAPSVPARMHHALPARPITTYDAMSTPAAPLPQVNMPPSFQQFTPAALFPQQQQQNFAFQQPNFQNAGPFYNNGQYQQPYDAPYYDQQQYQQPMMHNQPQVASFPSLAISPLTQQLPPAITQYAAPPPTQAAPAHNYQKSTPQPSTPFENRPSHRTKCLICDIQYPSPIMLIAHQRNEHVRCCKAQELGCTFEALPHVVEIHEQDRHLVFRPGAKRDSGGMDGPPK